MCDTLLAMVETPGEHFADVERWITEDLAEFEIKITAQVQQRFKRVRQLYLRSLRDHLLRRFPNIKLLSAFAALFDVSQYPSTETELEVHGVENIRTIARQFGMARPVEEVLVDEGNSGAVLDESVEDPWDEPNFVIPDVQADDNNMDSDEKDRDRDRDGDVKMGKDEKDQKVKEIPAVVDIKKCLAELPALRNWVLAQNKRYLESQQAAAQKRSNSESLSKAQKTLDAHQQEVLAKRQSRKSKPTAKPKPPAEAKADAKSDSKSGESKAHPVIVDGESKSAEAKHSQPAAASSAARFVNLTMMQLVLRLLNDASMAVSIPNIIRSVNCLCAVCFCRCCSGPFILHYRLAQIAVILPVATACCERGFSQVNMYDPRKFLMQSDPRC